MAQGYHAAAMDEIAERAGVSKPVLYQHFPGKRDLYLALIEQHSAEVVECLRGAIEGTTDNKMRVAGAMGAFFDFIDRENESFRLIFESDLTNDPDVRARVESVNEQCGRMVAELIHEESGLPWPECELIGMGLSGMAHVAARYWLQKGRQMPREEAVRLLAGITWRGIAAIPLQENEDMLPGQPSTPRPVTDLTGLGESQPATHLS
ncbi:TetR/AcrR family transcriptional regulator [Kineosporia mesophila]|uniref:TetR/AcrR family transcriptional regulator n=1 Tax=Kineosporia mesophila TaxID=566012 RepID=A0ABP6YXM3_9ACTN